MSWHFVWEESGKQILLAAPLGIAATIFLETAQQLLFKYASEAKNPKPLWTLAGAGLYVPQQLVWMFTLTLLPLAFAAPFLGASYVAVPFSSSLIFKEKITAIRWFGICLIVAGIMLISREMAP
jgi:drug/metabolite transporter (DMT)-like permease